MRRTSKALVISLSFSSKLLSATEVSSTMKYFPLVRPLSTTTSKNEDKNSKVPEKPNKKHSFILEQFRLRKLKGSQEASSQSKHVGSTTTCSSTGVEMARRRSEIGLENEKGGPTEMVSGFKELGLREEVIGALGEMGVCVPTEIQCVGIPAILDGKSVILSCESGYGRTLAYLLPLIQQLRQDEASVSMKPKHPRAIVLCTTEEQSDEAFHVAKLISDGAILKSTPKNGHNQSKGPENFSNAPIGMLVGTPSEVLQQIEEETVLCDDIKYLVLDEADTMLDQGFGPEIQKILNPLKNRAGFQTIIVTSTVTEMLGKQLSPVMECLENNHTGKVTAMMMELDQREVSDFIESPNALKQKVAQAIDSFQADGLGS